MNADSHISDASSSSPTPWTANPSAAAEGSTANDVDTGADPAETSTPVQAVVADSQEISSTGEADVALPGLRPEPAITEASVTEEVVTEAAASEAPAPATPPASTFAATPPSTTAAEVDAAIAERIAIPAGSSGDDVGESTGGEWDLLTSKVTDWWETNDIDEQINNLRQPLRVGAILIGLFLVLKVYSGLLAAIGSIPLAPRLLELVGVCWVARFSATRLVRSGDRREVLEGLRQRWSAFTGTK